MKIININPKSVVFDKLNPNKMSEKEFESLKKEIQKRGFVQPVIVRMRNNIPHIIDGEHRTRASIELNYEMIPAVDVGDVSNEEARIMLINLNRIKGEFSPVKFAELLEDLDNKLKEKLLEEVYMSDKELDSYRLLRKLEEIDEEDMQTIIEDTQLTTEIIKGTVLHLDEIKNFEFNQNDGYIKINDLIYVKDRIKKVAINFDKNLKPFIHLEIKPMRIEDTQSNE